MGPLGSMGPGRPPKKEILSITEYSVHYACAIEKDTWHELETKIIISFQV